MNREHYKLPIKKNDLAYTIINYCMKVHNTLGPGFQEAIYRQCLAIELAHAGLPFTSEQDQTVYYDGFAVATRRADFIVANVVVMLKAATKLKDEDLAQTRNYLVGYYFPKGLLINFGAKRLQFKIVVNTDYQKGSEFTELNDEQN